MSAWSMFAALGCYPVVPASNQSILGRPFLPHATLPLPNGKRLLSFADGLDDAPPCIGSASLNGRPLGRGRRVNAG
ncbi:glycoside hydrolase domain-containing protein [Xanthomonas graminis]|uniref:glycoside hydrolase domain-containing protein n=1 Tax=Xanthomonas graminis TaxID=3390026 RepID=UPI00396A3A30